MDFDQKIEIAKTVISLSVAISTGKIVNDVINNNVAVETVADRAKVIVGSFAIGGLVAEKVSEHTNQRFDKAVVWYKNYKKTQEDNSAV